MTPSFTVAGPKPTVTSMFIVLKNAILDNTIRRFVSLGLALGKDFVVIDSFECEMWPMIHADEIERPFWFEKGADWLQYKRRKGKMLVWYDRGR